MLTNGTIVFLSDIHMGSPEGLAPQHWRPWGWLGADRAAFLGAYLRELADDDRVRAVVVLGDLFDDWVVPAHLYPVEGDDAPDALLRRIAGAAQNQPIREGFRRLAERGKELRYVRGNHDMFLTDELLREWVDAFVCEPDPDGPGTGAYVLDGLLRAEHGCAYCLANAPYVEDGAYRYPVGYYLSRLDAYDKAVQGGGGDFLAAFADAVGDLTDPERAVGAAIRAEAALVRYPEGAPFIMNSAYPNTYTVASVADRFRNWLAEWNRRDYPVSATEALGGDTFGLRKSMRTLWLAPGKVRIALCGHTHRSELVGYPTSFTDPDRPCRSIYANTGAWVDKVYTTCVEVDIDRGANRAVVRRVRVRRNRPPLTWERFVRIED